MLAAVLLLAAAGLLAVHSHQTAAVPPEEPAQEEPSVTVIPAEPELPELPEGPVEEEPVPEKPWGPVAESAPVDDSYFDDVYTLENGAWKRVAYGEYYGYTGRCDEEQGRYICQTYIWNGSVTTMEGYMQALMRVYPLSVAQQPAFEYSHEEILRALQ